MLAKRVIISILAFTLYINTNGQTGSIDVKGGASVPLIVSSMAKYNNGMNLQSWTRLRVKFDAPATSGWILQVRPDFGFTNIISENLIDEIDIETLDIEAINVVDISGGGIPAFPKTITLAEGAYVELFNENFNTNVDFEVTISYRLGEKPSNRLIGVKSGFYNVDLRFTLISKP